jgi:hypothetical protein
MQSARNAREKKANPILHKAVRRPPPKVSQFALRLFNPATWGKFPAYPFRLRHRLDHGVEPERAS